MAFKLEKASLVQTKLRAALYGPSGSGKTFSALRIATGLGGKIAVIDTEHGSAAKYARHFTFDVGQLGKQNQTIDAYIDAIAEVGRAGYDVLVIDSLSHGWQELVVEVEKLAIAKYKGNTWSAWSEGTPRQKRLVEAILSFPGHVLATMRTKTEWTTEKNDRGRSTPTRVGLGPEQGKGIEYEFDFLIQLDQEHNGTVIKDRSGRYQDRIIDRPGEELGRDLAAWLSEGDAPPLPTFAPAPAPATTNGRNGTNGSAPKERKTWAETLDGAVRLWEKLDPRHDRKVDIARRQRIVNGLITWALEAELVGEEAITVDGARDRRLVGEAAAWLYDTHYNQVRAQIKHHIDDAIARDNAPPPPAREAQQRLPSADPSLPPVTYGDAAEFDECEQPPAEAN